MAKSQSPRQIVENTEESVCLRATYQPRTVKTGSETQTHTHTLLVTKTGPHPVRYKHPLTKHPPFSHLAANQTSVTDSCTKEMQQLSGNPHIRFLFISVVTSAITRL